MRKLNVTKKLVSQSNSNRYKTTSANIQYIHHLPNQENFEELSDMVIESIGSEPKANNLLDFSTNNAHSHLEYTDPYLGSILIQDLSCNDVNQLNPDQNKSDPIRIYLKEVRTAPLLSKDEEIYYSRLSLNGDRTAKNKMIESNLRLVIKIAKKYLKSGMALDDLIEEGNLGLIKAVEKFDPEKGFRFSTYSAWWIQQYIERAIMNQNRTIRLPIHIIKKLNHFIKNKEKITEILNQESFKHNKEHQELSSPLQDIRTELHLINEKIISLDAPISTQNQQSLMQVMGNSTLDPAKIVLKNSMQQSINLWLEQLNSTQKSIVELRFGLNNKTPKTLEETSKKIGLTRERVRQLQAQAIKSLQGIVKKHDDLSW